MASHEADILMDNAKDQFQSPLFGLLPAEIRQRIFEHALTSYDDVVKPYIFSHLYARAGYQFRQRIDFALLLSCKRIFTEARLLPVSQNEHIFWIFTGPEPPWSMVNGRRVRSKATIWNQWQRRLNADQKFAVKYVHIFIKQCFLENIGIFPEIPTLDFRTQHLKLTIRRFDWWTWQSPPESSDRLGICPWLEDRTSCQKMLSQPLCPDLSLLRNSMTMKTWGGQLCQVQDLQTLVLEFEVDTAKRDQLLAITERAKCWRFPIQNSNDVLEPQGILREYTWDIDALPRDKTPTVDVYQVSPQQHLLLVIEMKWKRVKLNN